MQKTSNALESSLSLLKKLDNDLSAKATRLDQEARKAREDGKPLIAHRRREEAIECRRQAGIAHYVKKINERALEDMQSSAIILPLRRRSAPRLVHDAGLERDVQRAERSWSPEQLSAGAAD